MSFAMSSSLTFHLIFLWVELAFARFFLFQRPILAAEVSKSVAGKHTSLARTPNFGFLKGLVEVRRVPLQIKIRAIGESVASASGAILKTVRLPSQGKSACFCW